MKTNSFLVTLGAFGAAAVFSLALNTADAADGANSASTPTDQQIQQLIAMSGPERRAYLRKMPVGQRGQLMFAMKRMKSGKSSIKGNAKYSSSVAVKSGAKRDAGSQQTAVAAGSEKSAQAPRERRAVGTIQYDNGVSTTSFGGGSLVGNRFDTHTGIPVLASANVSSVEAVVLQGASATSSSAGFVMLGPQTGGGGANAVFSSFTTASGATDTVNFSGLGASYTGASFYVLFGDFANSYVPAMGSGTTLGQGHHGVVGYTGGMGPNITGTFNLGGALNGLVRASGNIVPVELMNWSVD